MTFINSNNNSSNIMNLKWTEDLAYNSKWAPASIKSTQVPILPAQAVIIVSLHIRRSLRPPHRPLRPRLPLLLHQVGSFFIQLPWYSRSGCMQSVQTILFQNQPTLYHRKAMSDIFVQKCVQNTWLAEVLLKSPEIRHVNRY